jgi:hypothetical protein
MMRLFIYIYNKLSARLIPATEQQGPGVLPGCKLPPCTAPLFPAPPCVKPSSRVCSSGEVGPPFPARRRKICLATQELQSGQFGLRMKFIAAGKAKAFLPFGWRLLLRRDGGKGQGLVFRLAALSSSRWSPLPPKAVGERDRGCPECAVTPASERTRAFEPLQSLCSRGRPRASHHAGGSGGREP